MEVVQYPYEASNREGIPEDEGDFGPLGFGGLEQGDQFEGPDNVGAIFSIILLGRRIGLGEFMDDLWGPPTGEGNPKPGTAYDNSVCEAIRELYLFAKTGLG